MKRGAAEAEGLLRECLAIREKVLPEGHWQRANAKSILGGSLLVQKKFDEAEPLLLSGYDGLAQAKDTPAERLTEAQQRVVELYEKWGKPEQAEAWRKKQSVAVK